MTGLSYAEQIKRTKAGAIDIYHYFGIGDRISADAVMRRFWYGLTAGQADAQAAFGMPWAAEVAG